MDNKIFNRGIPSKSKLIFNFPLLEDNCTIDGEKYEKAMTNELNALTQKIRKEIPTMPFVLCGDLVTLTTNENKETNLTFDYHIFMFSVSRLLNVDLDKYIDENYYWDRELIWKEIRSKVGLLGKIKVPSKLEKEYPFLYEDYLEIKKYVNDYNYYKKNYNMIINQYNNKEDLDKNMYMISNFFKERNVNPNNYSFDSYITNIKKAFAYITKDDVIDKICNIIINTNINLDNIGKYIDIDKFDLLIASFKLKQAIDEDDYKLENISFVKDYINEHKDSLNNDIEIYIKNYGNTEFFTKKSLSSKYVEYLDENSDVRALPIKRCDVKDMTLDEIHNLVMNFDDKIYLSWKILDNPNEYIDKITSNIKIKNNMSEEEKQKRRESKIRILKEKKEFFSKYKPVITLLGKDTFTGYLCYVFNNGYVILEKYMKSKNAVAEDAVYIMDVDDFIRLTVLSKTNIIINKLCPRQSHITGWQDKVKSYIEKETTLESIDKINSFERNIRKLKQN